MTYSYLELREILTETRDKGKNLCLECLQNVPYQSLYSIKKYISMYNEGLCKTFDEFAEKFPGYLETNRFRPVTLGITDKDVDTILNLYFDYELKLNASHLPTVITLIKFGIDEEKLAIMLDSEKLEQVRQIDLQISNELALRGEL